MIFSARFAGGQSSVSVFGTLSPHSLAKVYTMNSWGKR